jgi:Neuraminidase (sialidase)
MRLTLSLAALLALLLLLAGPQALARTQQPPGQGFTRETAFALGHDDWEPAIAADSSGHVYWMTTRYADPTACSNCPKHFLGYKVSNDGGNTWSAARYLCPCPGFDAQNDPEIVTDAAGHLFAAWMNDYVISFSRSDDFGDTWSPYIAVDGFVVPPSGCHGCGNSDKPTIAVSASGHDVYVVYNSGNTGRPTAVSSHDGGKTWGTPVSASNRFADRYFFSGGSAVLRDGTVVTAQDVYTQDNKGTILMLVLRSTDGGEHWKTVLVGLSQEARPCPAFGKCPANYAFLGEQDTLAADSSGTAYVLFSASSQPKGSARLLMRRSTDSGATWGAPIDLAPGTSGEDHEFPMIAAGQAGDVRAAWMDDRTGVWNTYYRASRDGGFTWGEEKLVSNRKGGAPYKSADGFAFPYGDYGQIAIDGHGQTQATWGEGPSFAGPGDTWYARGG